LISSQCLYLAVAVIVLLLAWPLGAPDVHPQAHMQLALAAACVHARIPPPHPHRDAINIPTSRLGCTAAPLCDANPRPPGSGVRETSKECTPQCVDTFFRTLFLCENKRGFVRQRSELPQYQMTCHQRLCAGGGAGRPKAYCRLGPSRMRLFRRFLGPPGLRYRTTLVGQRSAQLVSLHRLPPAHARCSEPCRRLQPPSSSRPLLATFKEKIM
jgi:hypothetical protein